MDRTDLILCIRRNAAQAQRLVKFAGERLMSLRRAESGQYVQGTPDGLDESFLREVVGRLKIGEVYNFHYRQTSGWKATGAFRIAFETSKLGRYSLIYKNALYSDDEIPALNGLGIVPGRGEYVVYRGASQELQRYMPRPYWAEELEPGRHYRYLIEDLQPKYRTLLWERDRIAVCEILHPFHRALRPCSQTGHEADLPHFGSSFALHLLEYAHANLTTYHRHQPQAAVGALLGAWDSVDTTFRQAMDKAFSSCELVVVHGDCNVANVVFSREDGTPRMYDFEWAGISMPHDDLASILKGSSPRTEARGVAAYNRHARQRPLEADWQMYLFCSLRRALLDVSFVAKQSLEKDGPAVDWFRRFITGAAYAALRNSRRLANL